MRETLNRFPSSNVDGMIFTLTNYKLINMNNMNDGKANQDVSVQSLKEDWVEVKEHLRTQYPWLTDDDLVYEDGKEEKLIAILVKKLGKTREQVIDCLWGEWTAVEETHQAEH